MELLALLEILRLKRLKGLKKKKCFFYKFASGLNLEYIFASVSAFSILSKKGQNYCTLIYMLAYLAYTSTSGGTVLLRNDQHKCVENAINF
jgi:hypothetical protein